MAKIQVLDRHTAELIAAGEVVERPASVVKELLENTIDAGATAVTVEIRNGGVALISVSDNGSGIAREDVPIAFLRHATSKVRTEQDLEAIGTLGFRGEALASIAAVARVELLTRTADELAGTRYRIEGGEEVALEDTGCPQGTTILVRDLFYNVPARMKFLKKDVSEGNAVAGVVERLALSHPEVSFRFVREGREELLTPGDGSARSCIYTVLGREVSNSLIETDYTLGGVRVHGFVCKPSAGRGNRTMQHFFINGRYVKTRTAMAALEQAYKGAMMVGKFPACVLYLELPPEAVDANVHPAKIEVRFTNEKPVFDAVYHGVKSALAAGDTPARATLPAKTPERFRPQPPSAQGEQLHFREKTPPMQTAHETAKALAGFLEEEPPAQPPETAQPLPKRPEPPMEREAKPLMLRSSAPAFYPPPDIVRTTPGPMHTPVKPAAASDTTEQPLPEEPAAAQAEDTANPLTAATEERVVYVGEAFGTYLIVECSGSLFVIDKHAAHERMLYNRLRQTAHTDAQLLLEPVAVPLGREEYDALLPALPLLREAGFEVEDFGGSLLVRGLPMLLTGGDAAALLEEIAGGLLEGKRGISVDRLDWIYHSVACRAAVKAGDHQSPEELAALATRVMEDEEIRYCPHGRPVCFELTRRELEKQFGRIG